MDIVAVITFHREGIIAHKTLMALERCRRFADEHGLKTKFVITIDDADSETSRVVKNHPSLRLEDELFDVKFRDLSSCRNYAIANSDSRFVGIFDGDDYFSKNWIVACIDILKEGREKIILHPELMFAFGAEWQYWWQIDQDSEFYRKGALLTGNYWNASAFADRRIFLDFPYQVSRVGEAGFGFEDWHWNCETIAAGCVHRVVPKTIRFERRKDSGSLSVAHQEVHAVIRPTRFF